VSNVLSEEKKQQVIALGRLGWSLRRIQQATRIRRETASGYLKEAGVAVRRPGGWGRNPAKPAIEVATDPVAENPPDLPTPEAERQPGRSPSSSACEPYRELIELGLSRGRNAMAIWQDLVDDHGFTGRYNSVKRFVRKQRGVASPEARVVIETAPGEEAQVDYGEGPMVRDPVADGKRKEYMESVATVPLLIVDDFGMRKLPHTAAEDLLEIVMRRYERASTLLTSNRPVEDWGKLLGDVAAVSAMLDRLLHHGHVLKCGPRSWRTKTAPAS
jgi:hypothetical protein